MLLNYKDLVETLEKDRKSYSEYRYKSAALVSWLKFLVGTFNKDLAGTGVKASSLRWNYRNGKTIDLVNGGLPAEGFNKAFSKWREITGCEANFFVHSGDDGEVERLEILDITNNLYASTQTDNETFLKMMEDASEERSP